MDVRLTPLPQELRNQITYLSSVISAFEESSAAFGHAAAGQRWAVPGDFMYGGKVQLAHGSVI